MIEQTDLGDVWVPLSFSKKNKVFELPRPLAPLFDTHAHLRSFVREDRWVTDILARAYEAGVRRIVSVYDAAGDCREDIPDVAGYAAWLARALNEGTHPLPRVQYLAGVHPYGAAAYDDAIHAQLEAMLDDPRCAGIGEFGLDYHFDDDDEVASVPHEVQATCFARQLELAVARNMPVELHLRNLAGDEARAAHTDALRILDEVGVPQAGCVLHCFGEDRATMEAYLERGCHIAFGGATTFKRNEAVREAFAACPLDRALFETDCPYMAPEPIRGLECEPAMIAQTADVLIYDRADRTGELPEQIAQAIWDTSNALFA